MISFGNLPSPLFTKEGEFSSFENDIYILNPPFVKGDEGGLLNLNFIFLFFHEYSKFLRILYFHDQ